MKTAIILEINSCAVCPYVKFVNSTEVKFSYNYYCTKKQEKWFSCKIKAKPCKIC